MDIPVEITYYFLSYLSFQKFPLRQVCFQWRELLPTETLVSFRDNCYIEGLLSYIKFYNLPFTTRNIYLAIRNRHIDIFFWSLNNGFFINCFTVNEAIKSGCLPIIEYIAEKELLTSECSSYSPNKEILLWLEERGYPPTEETVVNASRTNNRELLNYCLSRNLPVNKWVFNFMADKDIKILQEMHDKKFPYSSLASCRAAQKGRIDILKWMKKNDYPFYPETCAWAAKGGNLRTLQWLRRKSCPWDQITLSYAARKGHLDILQWAYENGCPCSDFVFFSAVLGGEKKIVKYLLTIDCPYSPFSYSAAVGRNNVKLLRWLLKRYPWDEEFLPSTIGYCTKLSTVKFLVKNNCPWDLSEAVYKEDTLSIYKFLYKKGYTLTSHSYLSAIIEGNLDTMQFLYEKRVPFSHELLDYALLHENIYILRFLQEKGCPVITNGFSTRNKAIIEWFEGIN